MDRRRVTLPIAAAISVAVCAAVIFLSVHRPPPPSAPGLRGPLGPEASTSSSTIGPRVDEATGALTIKVGDAALSNGVSFSVTDMNAPYSTPGTQARQGELVKLDIEIRNTGASGGPPFEVSSAKSFELQDDGGRSYPPASVPAAIKAPDGSIGPGAGLQGSLIYDLPYGHTYRLLYKNEQLSAGQVAVDLGQI
jgi:hypothetical protein